MPILAFEERRERGDLISVYKSTNDMEEINRENLPLEVDKKKARYMRQKKVKRQLISNTSKYILDVYIRIYNTLEWTGLRGSGNW